jgi:hypothetical protein
MKRKNIFSGWFLCKCLGSNSFMQFLGLCVAKFSNLLQQQKMVKQKAFQFQISKTVNAQIYKRIFVLWLWEKNSTHILRDLILNFLKTIKNLLDTWPQTNLKLKGRESQFKKGLLTQSKITLSFSIELINKTLSKLPMAFSIYGVKNPEACSDERAADLINIFDDCFVLKFL